MNCDPTSFLGYFVGIVVAMAGIVVAMAIMAISLVVTVTRWPGPDNKNGEDTE